jgi:hypothetical protein
MGQTLSEPVIDKVRMSPLLARWSAVVWAVDRGQVQDAAWRARALEARGWRTIRWKLSSCEGSVVDSPVS